MLGTVSWPELLLILAIVLLIFGVGRIARVGSELGKGVSEFRKGLNEGKEDEEQAKAKELETKVEP
jgi:sec-independent protein translocase protein TatA